MMTKPTFFVAAIAFLLTSSQACAQATKEHGKEEVIVTGTFDPLPLEELERNVRSINTRSLELVTNTLADILKLDSSVDLRQRAPNGLQADISIRGGTFGQTLVLLNGLRINDPQSGHHNFDLPVPLESISSVEILKGSGSTLYGSDAVGGVVNVITRTPEHSELRLRTAIGSFGVNQQRGSGTFSSQRFSQQFVFSRDFSTGFAPNRDYRNVSAASTSNMTTALGITELQFAHADRPFGADQFYGNYNSWERTKTWWAAIRQQLGRNTDASFSFRRHTDLFVLDRYQPGTSTNRHAAESVHATLRRRNTLSRNTTFHYGGEFFRDAVQSNNLGDHTRARGAGYVSLDVRSVRRFSFTMGLRDEVWGSDNHELSPSVGMGYWIGSSLKARLSLSRAFRLPTYTDLYYRDPFNIGSPSLRPESAWNYEGGLDWYVGRVRVNATIFHRRERDGIDYVRPLGAIAWNATNFQRLRFIGLETAVTTRLRRSQEIGVQYTAIQGTQDTFQQFESKYVFNYPSHSGLVTWQGNLPRGIVARSRTGILKRIDRNPYAVWDVYLTYAKGAIRPFVQVTNLTATRYEEVPRVAMPGRAFVGGFEWVVVPR